MKIEEKTNVIHRHGVVSRKECTLSASSHMFKLLARQYSDPIKAIVQELGANCLDSHKRANKEDVPFSVSLPNSLDPHIRFRDYGTSMSTDVINNVYTGYGKSDKRESNTETGYFGIGSKTPLAYSDSFNITTYLDGTMRMYALAYNETSTPELNSYGEFPTDEPNGVEVSFSVDEKDWDKFYTAARHVFSFYDTQPIVNGRDDYSSKRYEARYSGEGWKIVDEQKSYVVMGNIGYIIEPYRISHLTRGLLYKGLHINVDMGAVDITPSRESLEYTNKTIKSIEEALFRVTKDIKIQVKDMIESCDSQYSSVNLYVKLKQYFPFIDTEEELKNIKTSVYLNGLCKYHSNGSNRRVSRSLERGDKKSLVNGYIFVIKDIKKGFDSRCRKYVQDNGRSIYLFENNNSKEELCAIIGSNDNDAVVFYVSELPEVEKDSTTGYARTGGKRKTTKKLKVFVPSGNSVDRNNIYNSKFWQYEEVDVKNGEHIYVHLDRYDIVSDTISMDLSFNTFLRNNSINTPKIVALSNKDNNLSKRSNFKSLASWIIDRIKELLTENVKKSIQFHKSYSQLNHASKLDKINNQIIKSKFKFYDENSDFKKLLDIISDSESVPNGNKFKKAKNLIDLCSVVKYNLDTGEDLELMELQSSCKQKYGVLFFAIQEQYDFYMNEDFCKMVIDTVNAFDRIGE